MLTTMPRTPTLVRHESEPTAYPGAPDGLSEQAAELDPAVIWHRLEQWVSHRWTVRAVVWIAEGPGEWRPDLTPAAVDTTEVFKDGDYQPVTLDPSAFGGFFLCEHYAHRFTGTAGPEPVPPAVNEAFRRLAEYIAGAEDRSLGVTSSSMNLGGQIQRSFDRPMTWLARAIHNSGAADLLRPYRSAP